jgi:hypothetical protein
MNVGTAFAAVLLALVTLVTPPMIAAQSPPPAPVPTSPTPTPGASPGVVLQVVEVTQAVPAGGTGVTGFTPPAGTMLVVTDMLVTNPNTQAACGVDLARAGTAVTGGLCVAPQTTLEFAFTTGIEFTDAAPVQFVNASAGTEPIRIHLRGFLMPAAAPAPVPTG